MKFQIFSKCKYFIIAGEKKKLNKMKSIAHYITLFIKNMMETLKCIFDMLFMSKKKEKKYDFPMPSDNKAMNKVFYHYDKGEKCQHHTMCIPTYVTICVLTSNLFIYESMKWNSKWPVKFKAIQPVFSIDHSHIRSILSCFVRSSYHSAYI